MSDAEGYPVNLDRRPTEAEHAGWDVVVSPATDGEGWQYASVFKCAASLDVLGTILVVSSGFKCVIRTAGHLAAACRKPVLPPTIGFACFCITACARSMHRCAACLATCK